VGVQKVRSDKEGTVREGDYIFSMEKAKKSSIGKRTLGASQNNVNRELSLLVTGYIGRWCNVLVLKPHEPPEEKSDELKTVFMSNYRGFYIIFLSTI